MTSSDATTSSKAGRFAAGVLYTTGLISAGLMLGALLGTRVFGRSDMGWDQLANGLGGAALGALAGLVIAVLTLRRFQLGRQIWAGVGAWVLGAAILVLLQQL